MATRPPKIPGRVVVALVVAVVLDTVTHVTWKLAVAPLPEGASVAQITMAALSSPLFLVGLLAYGIQFYNWMRLLKQVDLSFAQPLTALGYVAVLAISAGLLHERVSPARVAGVALILAGVFFVSRTPFRTAGPDELRAPAPLP